MRYTLRLSIGAAALAALLCLLPAAICDAAVPTDFADTTVASGFSQPVGFAFLPDGRALVIEQVSANIRLVVNGSIGSNDPLVTVPDVYTSGNERGLLGIAVDPGWPTRPYIYVYYSHSGTFTNYISMFEVGGDLTDPNSENLTIAASSRYDLLTDIPDNNYNHNGGTLRFGTDGMLYCSIGDDAVQCTSQELDDLRGVILRLDVSLMPGTGSGPPPKADLDPGDNPFVSLDPNTRLVYALGLRNPFRFNVDPDTGHLFIADVGLYNYEEMNQCQGGENFGWPFREGPMTRTPGGCSEPGGPGGTTYDSPIDSYDRSGFTASIISGTLYRQGSWPTDDSFPAEYDGDCFYVEYYQGWMRRLTWNGSAWVQAPPVAGQPTTDNWATGLQYASDFLVGPDGAIWYIKQFPGELRKISYTAAPSLTIGASFDCDPASGTVPFSTLMSAQLQNLYTGQTRRIAGRVNVTLASGSSISNWRGGYTNVAAGDSYAASWNQAIPAVGSVIGTNTFELVAEDVTPAPYNQPPYPAAGDTAVDSCEVVAYAP
jgi:glucose/arabinose dehydrogenase